MFIAVITWVQTIVTDIFYFSKVSMVMVFEDDEQGTQCQKKNTTVLETKGTGFGEG